ncbi:hypothetical protein T08_3292 [Trichinella sp. T8]|nr:hypothetical protein T08_3292 [Trichinella sp. T8]
MYYYYKIQHQKHNIMIMHKSSADICDYYYHYHHHDYYYYIQYNDCNESEKLSSIDALSSDIRTSVKSYLSKNSLHMVEKFAECNSKKN